MGDSEDLIDEEITLQRGENLLEIHLGRFLSTSVIQAEFCHDGEEPQFFCTIDVYDFETQSTRVIRGLKPDFDITSQYPVKVDDFFLHWLQKVRRSGKEGDGRNCNASLINWI